MKKFTLFCFSILLSIISLFGQAENKDPLVIIDGKISGTPMNSINPNNIESMTVSKSQSFKEEYGILAENGVISIVTKDHQTNGDLNTRSAEPLVLINNKVYTESLDSIGVREIGSINVLKGVSATKLYGRAGENGVILVTLKNK